MPLLVIFSQGAFGNGEPGLDAMPLIIGIVQTEGSVTARALEGDLVRRRRINLPE